ncbi:anaphase-promoting complex component apc8 [Gurleya vavrai]
MNDEFFKRCLYKSLNLIKNLNIESNKSKLSPREKIAISLFNQKDFTALENFPCDFDCNCCSPSILFLKEYSKLIKCKINNLKYNYIETSKLKNDIYFLYLKSNSENCNKIEILMQILKQENYFFEAFEDLMFNTTQDNFYLVEEFLEKNINDTILLKYYICYLFITRFIVSEKLGSYFIDIQNYFLKNEIKNDLFVSGYKVEKLDENINYYMNCFIAAVYYHKKDYKQSLIFFKKNNNVCSSFLDLYSNIFYIKNEIKKLAILSQDLVKKHPMAPETFVAIANYYSLNKNHEKAIEYFLKSIKLDERFASNFTLIGHEYIEMENISEAIVNYSKSLKFNSDDHRALFGMAQALTAMKTNEQAFFFYKKTCKLQPLNSYFWVMFGTCAVSLKKYEDAEFSYKRAISLGDEETLVKLGDCYKNMKRYEEAVRNYEKYVKMCIEKKIDCRKISNFLAEYFKKIGNEKKSNFYELANINEKNI